MKKIIFLIVVLVITSVQCKTTVQITQEQRQTINTNSFVSEMAEPDFAIKSAVLNGDVLTLIVEFKGNKCGNEFDLLWDGSFMKSLPPKVMLVPVHKAAEEGGSKTVEMTLLFGLDALKEKSAGYSEIIITIRGYTESLNWTK
jgi:hypothetical protein